MAVCSNDHNYIFGGTNQHGGHFNRSNSMNDSFHY